MSNDQFNNDDPDIAPWITALGRPGGIGKRGFRFSQMWGQYMDGLKSPFGDESSDGHNATDQDPTHIHIANLSV